MTDELLPYYQRELAFLRKAGHEFAEANPKIAARLRLDTNLSDDPHVARLIEAFAYLNARTRLKLEDDFPEITEAMLGVLYPHYLAPIPSLAIVQLALDRTQSELVAGQTIPRGTGIESEPSQNEGDPCRFRTCYETTVWPMEVKAAAFKGHPFSAPSHPAVSQAVADVRIELQTNSPKTAFRQMNLQALRFYLAGQSQYVYDLHELLLNNSIGILLATGPDDPEPLFLKPRLLRPIGFDRDQALIDYSPQSFLGYRLLTEYFTFPDKFLFVEVAGLTPRNLQRFGERLEIHILLNRHLPDLEKNVNRDTFRLGCTPIVNLFRRRAEPIRLTQTETEYRVVPDARRPRSHEVYSIERVVGTTPAGRQVDFAPFYSVRHSGDSSSSGAFWYAQRRQAGYAGGKVDAGTELYLTLVDLDFSPAAWKEGTVDVETICLNRDMPRWLPFGGGHPRLQFTEGTGLVRIQCLTRPTPTFRPPLRHGTAWRLISHLTLNHLSLLDTSSGADALREILQLYDFRDSEETRSIVQSVLHIKSRRVVGRVGGEVAAGFCRGVEVEVELAEEHFAGSGVFLFASVLDRFFALYSSINSFTRTVARSNQREKAICRWPPRAGERVLL
jgi:type VI secretion system protein ImpG